MFKHITLPYESQVTNMRKTILKSWKIDHNNVDLDLINNYLKLVNENLQLLVTDRLTKEDLGLFIARAIGTPDLIIPSDIDNEGLVADYAFIVGIFEDFGYIDIFYLVPPMDKENLYITEIKVSAE